MNESAMISTARRVFCSFRVDGALYGIDLKHLREVNIVPAITPVPQAPPCVRGLVNLRSRLFLILDVRSLLGAQPADCSADSRLLMLKPGVMADVGLLVDSGGDIASVPSEQIESCGKVPVGREDFSRKMAAELVEGICKLDLELMMIIDPGRLAELIAGAMIVST